MGRRIKFKYYVIQFPKIVSLRQDINEYVCIPWSWIVMRRTIDQKVLVSYPKENPSDTAKRVKRRQKPSKDWCIYEGLVKYRTDVYEDALIFINEQMNVASYENKCSNVKNGDQKLPIKVKIKLRNRKQNSKSNHEINKPLDLVATSKNNDKSETERLKQRAQPTPDTEPAVKWSKEVQPIESVSDTDATNQPSQASDCSNENQASLTREDFPIRNSCSPQVSVEESDNRSCVEDIEHVDTSEQERPSVIQNNSKSTDLLSNPRPPVLEPTLFTDLLKVIQNLQALHANSYTLVKNLHRILIDNTETLKDVKQLIVDSRSPNSDIQTSSSPNITEEVEKISETNNSNEKQRDEEYNNHTDDETDEVPKKKRFTKRKIVLPPEYDANDSRWTLKHREMAPGLVELMPHTNVYINAIKLSNCKRLAKDCKTLARLLLVEIFTKSALAVCSLTGARARAYDVEGATIRPGLDENARTVLLTYVDDYGREKGWMKIDPNSIQNSIRNKMQEFRFKYG